MRLSVVLFIAAFVLFAVIVEVVRRRRLSESYALLWICVAVVALVLGLARPLVDRVSTALGVSYGSNLVFAIVCLFLLVFAVNLSIHVSRLEAKVETLAQELALRDVQTPDLSTPDDDTSGAR
jgi:hypothetical protein